MNKQTNVCDRLLYTKWQSTLPDVRCKNEVSNILLLLTLLYKKENIFEIIEILFNIADLLKLTDNIVKDKIMTLQRDLITIKNCRCAIYW